MAKITDHQISGQVYAYGVVASNISDGVKTLYPVASVGITFGGANSYTVVTKGIYAVSAQQLQTTGGGATYFRIDINGAPVRYAYLPGGVMRDAIVQFMGELNTGNVISIYQQGAINAAWEGQHSSYQIQLIKAT